MNLGRIFFRHRLKTLAGMAVIIGLLLSQLPKLTSDNSNDVYFHPSDPTLVAYHAFQEQFGRDETLLVAVTPPNVFETAFLEKLQAFHSALEDEVPHLKEVTSLVNVRNTRGEGDALVVDDLMASIPHTDAEMAAWRERVLSSPLYPDLYISRDGTMTALILETLAFSEAEGDEDLSEGFDQEHQPGEDTDSKESALPNTLSEKENAEVIAAVKSVVERFKGDEFPVYLTGMPVITEFFNRAIERDVGTFMSLAVMAFTIFLLVLFRRFTGALLPIILVMLSMLCTLALMAIFGAPFTSVTSILPSFMMSVGIGASVHVLAIFFRHYREHGDKEEAVAFTFGHSGLPIFMTGVTTAAGLLSFSTSEMRPIADLGLYGGLGVLVILVFTIILMPALISLLPLRANPRFEGKRTGKGMDTFLIKIAEFSTGQAWPVVIVSAAIIMFSAAGLFHQSFGHSIFKWLPYDSNVRIAIELVDQEMSGAVNVEVVANIKKENGLYDPEVMNKLEALARFAEQYKDKDGFILVGKTTSVVDVVKETHRALNANDPAYYRLPQDRKLVAQELLLFENSGNDDLERLVDSQFSQARMTAKVMIRDAHDYLDFVTQLETKAQSLFNDSQEATVTGSVKLFTRTIEYVMTSMARSYTIAGVIITILMILMLGSVRIGLLSMIPNLAPIVITLGVMGWVGIKLDMSNMLLGTVAIGLAVDDTIHFFHNFRNYYARHGNTREAVKQTMLGTGRAILFTTLVLVTGFWLFMFASLINLIHFGFLIGLTLIMALLADILLAPAMMELITRTDHGRKILARWS